MLFFSVNVWLGGNAFRKRSNDCTIRTEGLPKSERQTLTKKGRQIARVCATLQPASLLCSLLFPLRSDLPINILTLKGVVNYCGVSLTPQYYLDSIEIRFCPGTLIFNWPAAIYCCILLRIVSFVPMEKKERAMFDLSEVTASPSQEEVFPLR